MFSLNRYQNNLVKRLRRGVSSGDKRHSTDPCSRNFPASKTSLAYFFFSLVSFDLQIYFHRFPKGRFCEANVTLNAHEAISVENSLQTLIRMVIVCDKIKKKKQKNTTIVKFDTKIKRTRSLQLSKNYSFLASPSTSS